MSWLMGVERLPVERVVIVEKIHLGLYFVKRIPLKREVRTPGYRRPRTESCDLTDRSELRFLVLFVLHLAET